MRGDADPAAGTLLTLEGVTKDYPKVATGADRLRTMLSLAFRRSDVPHFRAGATVRLRLMQFSVFPQSDRAARPATLQAPVLIGRERERDGDEPERGRIG